MITAFGLADSSWIFLQALTDALMLRPKSKSANCSRGPGESITRIISSQDILRRCCGIRFGLLSMSGESKELLRISGFIWLLHRRHKFLTLALDGRRWLGFGGYRSVGRTMIVASRAFWQPLLIKILPQMSQRIRSFPFPYPNSIDSSRGHFYVAVKGTF